MIPAKKNNIIYMIDLGLSKRYICPKSGKHIADKTTNGLSGTPRYCSISAYNRNEQSRRDDLEAVGNVLIYLANGGNLPWIEYEE